MLTDDDRAWLTEWAEQQWLKGRYFLLGFSACLLAFCLGGFGAFWAFAEQWRHEWREQAPRRVAAGQGGVDPSRLPVINETQAEADR